MNNEVKTVTFYSAPPLTLEEIQEAWSLRQQGLSFRTIAKKMGRSKSVIHRQITKFANNLNNLDMSKKRIKASDKKSRAQRLTGMTAPETAPPVPSTHSQEALEDKVKRLEKELADARLARDFYNEMINVAESQFNINIRKKAGTRQ